MVLEGNIKSLVIIFLNGVLKFNEDSAKFSFDLLMVRK